MGKKKPLSKYRHLQARLKYCCRRLFMTLVTRALEAMTSFLVQTRVNC